MTAVLEVMISDHATATVAGEQIARGRHRTINDAAMDRCKAIARVRRERVAVRAKAINGIEHWVWAYSDGKVSRMSVAEIRVAERAIQIPADDDSAEALFTDSEAPSTPPDPPVDSPVVTSGVLGLPARAVRAVVEGGRALPTFLELVGPREQRTRSVVRIKWPMPVRRSSASV